MLEKSELIKKLLTGAAINEENLKTSSKQIEKEEMKVIVKNQINKNQDVKIEEEINTGTVKRTKRENRKEINYKI
jgi:hypothetical protein